MICSFGFPRSLQNLDFMTMAQLLNLIQNDIIMEQQPISDPIASGQELPSNPCKLACHAYLAGYTCIYTAWHIKCCGAACLSCIYIQLHGQILLIHVALDDFVM